MSAFVAFAAAIEVLSIPVSFEFYLLLTICSENITSTYIQIECCSLWYKVVYVD